MLTVHMYQIHHQGIALAIACRCLCQLLIFKVLYLFDLLNKEINNTHNKKRDIIEKSVET